jgi:predicted transposase/invertase (TIGR01784 family)
LCKGLLPPKSDFIFKRIFGDQKNSDILAAFLRAVLSFPENEFHKLTIIDPSLQRETPDGKLGILDVKLETTNGKVIDIEIQILPLPGMKERIIFYTSRMITDQISKGESYNVIKQAISIVITDYVLINDNNDYHNRYGIVNRKTGEIFSDIFEIDTLELPKLPPCGDGSDLDDWLRFLTSKSEEEFDMLAQKNAPLNKAVAVLKELSLDEQTRLLFLNHEKAERDALARIQGARAEGRAEGEAKGRAEGEANTKTQTAINLLKMKIYEDTIANATGLTHAEIKELQERI